MKIVSSIAEIAHDKDITLTLGNFDGVHLGHQKVIQYIVAKSREQNGVSLIITFSPHPLLILKPMQNFLICTSTQRRKYIEELGVDYIYEINFTRDLSLQTPKEFLENYIYHKNIKNIFLGHDFSFGANKQGNYEVVKSYFASRSHNATSSQAVNVYSLDEFNFLGSRVSSTQIRELIRKGDVHDASKLLGRYFMIQACVKKGLQRGTQLGFPTANLDYNEHYLVPQIGSYISLTTYKEKRYYSVTNIGVNPTFGDVTTLQIETHIIDFDKDIYGEQIQVEFVERLRDERKFSSVDELKLQIALDIKTAYQYLNT